jgi:plastocyanin domain-containing protein
LSVSILLVHIPNAYYSSEVINPLISDDSYGTFLFVCIQAAVRGESEVPNEGEVDVRLSLLALLEGN